MKKTTVSLILLMICAACFCLASCEVPRCDHRNSDTVSVAPTCEGKGHTIYTCNDCGYTFSADYVAPLGHAFEQEVVSPTCTSDGYTLHVCSVCGEEKRTDVKPAVAHDYEELKIEPSCESQGYTYAKCNDCGYYMSYDFVKPTNHTLSSEVTAPTCTEGGYTTYSCDDCSYKFESDFTPPVPHELDAAVTAPTCEDQGYTTHSCKSCSYKFETDFTAPTGHDYETEVIRPNLERTGHTVYTCKTCSSSHISDFVFYSDIFSGAAGEGAGELAWGVDVSYHNGEIDWEKVKAAGVDYAIIRIGSSNGKDPMFEANYEGARAAGLDVGVYFYTYSLDAEGAKRDAALTLEWLNGRRLEYPVFYDIEDYEKGGYYPSELPEEVLMAMCHNYMSALIDGGYLPGLYTNNNFLYSKYNEEKVLGLYEVWYARYRYNDYLEFEQAYSGTYSMWQYSDSGSVDGIEGNVDLNLSFKDYPALMKEHGFNGY